MVLVEIDQVLRVRFVKWPPRRTNLAAHALAEWSLKNNVLGSFDFRCHTPPPNPLLGFCFCYKGGGLSFLFIIPLFWEQNLFQFIKKVLHVR